MLNPITFVTTPEYLFHPRQAFQRFRRLWHRPQARELIRLPWGAVVMAHTGEMIGRGLYYYGVFDKVVPEAIARLLDREETAIEVGANIGQNCSLMARRVGPGGAVLAFEPHPEIVAELRQNAARWDRAKFAPIQIEQIALGSANGEALLDCGEEFETNRGSASLRTAVTQGGRRFQVKVARLDEYINNLSQVAVCKIDVEGHELEVLRGAKQALRRGAIRDIIFEDFAPQPSPVTEFLQQHGYEVFKLGSGRLKPFLLAPSAPQQSGQQETHNFLATLDPVRARARYRPMGWRCLMYL
ncbi:MAG TPA: FkbM family methyltransferase [Candidatus Limnocylindria bacterium]|nr:FkbM family methyltransferase [Candidatus Limnocylindria bacterium]